jgi:predicted DNA-binding transcriptional regulator AlpA
MTLIRRADIEQIFESHVYTKKVKPERKPITEFYTTTEIKEKFGVSESWVFKIGKEKNIPKILHHGKTYWSKQHVEKHFAKHIENNAIVEWYSVQDMMEKFNMTTSAVYCFVSKYGIPKKKVKSSVFYSKQHVDAAKGINEPPKEEFYTMKEAVKHFGMTEDQIYKYAKKAKVSKHMEGRIVLMNKQELDAALAPPSI